MKQNGEIDLYPDIKVPALDPVLAAFYPDLSFGSPGISYQAFELFIAKHGLDIAPDTLASQRAGSRQQTDAVRNFLAVTLLLNELKKDKRWQTRYPGTVMKAVVLTAESAFKSDEDNDPFNWPRTSFGMKRSSGLTDAIATKFGVSPQDVARILRGIRIDGALLALDNERAAENLRQAFLGYTRDQMRQPRSVRHNEAAIFELMTETKSRDPVGVYRQLFKPIDSSSCNRRIGCLVPYELEYWRWCISAGLINHRHHLPYSEIIINAYAQGRRVIDAISNEIVDNTGIPVDGSVNRLRYRYISQDFPAQFLVR